MAGEVRSIENNSPHRAREKADFSPAARMLMSVGIGCYLGWQTIDISPTLFPTPLSGVRETLGIWGYAATTLLLFLLLVFAVSTHRKPGMLIERRWLISIACMGPALGTALLYLCGWIGVAAHFVGVAIGRILFATSAGLVVLWGELLSSCGAAHMLGCTAGGYGISFGICLIEACLSPEAALVFRPILPLLSGATLLALRTEVLMGWDTRGSRRGSWDGPSTHALPSLKPFIATGALGAVFIATNHLSETKTTVSTEFYTLVAGICVCLVILAIAQVTQGKIGSFSRLYRLITPFVIGCLLLTLVLEPGSQHYEALAIGGVWAFFRVFTWTLWARIGEHDPRGGAFVFAVGQIALTTCSTTSEILCSQLNLSGLPLVGTAAAIIAVTVLVSVFLLEDGEVVKRLEMEEAQERGGYETPSQATSMDLSTITLEEMAYVCGGLGLSEREREISLLVLQGNSNAFICDTACITESTLRTHLRNIYAKTDTHSREELISLLETRVQSTL